ncbi:MAG: methyltransferase domain-containing protein [Hyphomicrobiales bacterium]
MRFVNARVNAVAVEALRLSAGEHVVEIGCGPGHALKLLLASSPDATVTGIDHSAVMIGQAAALNAKALREGRLTLLSGDFTDLPFASQTVDAVLAVNVAYFMQGAQALAEARRILRPGGRIVVYVTHTLSMRSWRFAGPHTHRLFDEHAIGGMLASAGFLQSEIEVRTVDAGFGIKGLIAKARMT